MLGFSSLLSLTAAKTREMINRVKTANVAYVRTIDAILKGSPLF